MNKIKFYARLDTVPWLARFPRKIYVASSWRNTQQPHIVQSLRAAGHEVYAFRNPAPGNKGFAWRDCGGPAAEEGPGSGAKTVSTYVSAIQSTRAEEGFQYDLTALDWADTCVMVLPCGRSAHLEAGYACGQGKHVIWVLSEEGFEPELMYRLGHDFVVPNGVPFVQVGKTTDDARFSYDGTLGDAYPHFTATRFGSSNVAGVGHDGNGGLLVKFHDGKVYIWEGLAAEHHAALIDSDSPGSYIHKKMPKGKPFTE